MSRARALLLGLAASLLALGAGAEARADAPDAPDAPDAKPLRPNIVVIIGDDQGYPDFGFMGSPHLKTPNLDQLAAEGVVFTHGFNTSSFCRMALASLLTGLHPEQWHARVRRAQRRKPRRPPNREILDFETLPRLLSRQGYATFQSGKYWEGTFEDGGFTHGTKTSLGATGKASMAEIGRSSMQPLWDFLDAHRKTPFYVWFAPKLPHLPHDAPTEFEKPFVEQGLSDAAIKYYANIARLDARVGELLAYLGRHGLRERTLVLFLTDNGWQQGPHEPALPYGGAKGKYSMFELGFRTPIVWSWPGQLPGGRRSDALVSTVDLFPTLLEVAGAPPRAGIPGRNLWPLVTGATKAERTRVIGSATLVAADAGERLPPHRNGKRPARAFFLRNAEWYFIWEQARKRERLYSVVRDPLQEHDVAVAHPEVMGALRAEIEAWQRRMQASTN